MRPIASLSMAVLGLTLSIAVSPAAAAGPGFGRTERAMVRSIDRHRADYGLRALRASRALARAADFHSREMLAANYFAHNSRNGASFATRVHRFVHARSVGETLAFLSSCRYRPVHRVVSMWMHSSTHRAIVLSGGFHRVGIGLRKGRLGSHRVCVVTADFAR